jgi:hypothetical protein
MPLTVVAAKFTCQFLSHTARRRSPVGGKPCSPWSLLFYSACVKRLIHKLLHLFHFHTSSVFIVIDSSDAHTETHVQKEVFKARRKGRGRSSGSAAIDDHRTRCCKERIINDTCRLNNGKRLAFRYPNISS